MERSRSLWTLAVAGLVLLGGCRVDSESHATGDHVKIATPFGGLQVKTDDAAVLGGVGLPPYPGAERIKKEKDNGAADINMSFGKFQLRVKAISYRTSDSADKVQAFYQKALGRFGDVIQCSNHRPVGPVTRTAEGLTCDKDQDKNGSDHGDSSGDLELKAGSEQHQHIVAIEREGGGTKIGLVALDLPGHISGGDSDSRSAQ